MIKPDGQILVIFGASGDLTKRKLLPSLYELFARDMLPENFVILGVARTPFSDEEFRIQQKDNLKAFLKGKHPEAKQLDAFLERVHYLGFNSDEAAEYHLLVEKIAELRKAKDIPDHLIFYLATPPQKYGPIAEALRKSKLNKASEEGGWRRIIVEKPFGSSLETAQALNKQLCSIFDEEDIYRIDHFLGKETVQNILVLRFANQIFESLWNRNYIDSIEIYAAEKLGTLIVVTFSSISSSSMSAITLSSIGFYRKTAHSAQKLSAYTYITVSYHLFALNASQFCFFEGVFFSLALSRGISRSIWAPSSASICAKPAYPRSM